jgi:putative acetyltransferase
MIEVSRTDSNDPDFISLVKLLDAELAERDGSEHSFYAQFNKINLIKHAVVLYEDDKAVACGAMKEYESSCMEIKRMFTIPGKRGKGFAGRILQELETWAAELQYNRSILETGKKQPEAIALYKKSNYNIIPNYGQYSGVENSVCFQKELAKS